MTNLIWTILVLVALAAAAYFLVPMIGDWMNTGMSDRDTMNRPSSMDVRDNLPKK